MSEQTAGYAVFLFDPAIEALGEAVKPYLQDGPAGPHIACNAVDTGGAFVELTLTTQCDDGSDAEVELMIPMQMVRMIVSMRSDGAFGFAARATTLRETPLPVVGPAAPAPDAPSAAVPATLMQGGAATVEDDRLRPPEG